MKQATTFAYGVTTVPERIKNHLLARTLKSLAAAGFDEPHLFVDGLDPSKVFELSGSNQRSFRFPTIGVAGNWILALWELYLRNPTAHRYLLFQDDIVVCKNLRQYLASMEYEEKTYYNLITYEQNEPLADGQTGWYHSNQMGRGAQALMFDREAVWTLLSARYLTGRMQDARCGPKSIDGTVSRSIQKQGWREKVHMPSLVAHTGDNSTIQHVNQKAGMTFPGEEWDPMQDTLVDSFSEPNQVDSLPQICGGIPTTEIKRLVGDSPVLLEIGCHDGSDTEHFLNGLACPRIYCFDPEQRALDRFKRRIGTNPNVVLYETAVADVDGDRQFYASTGKAGRREDWDYSGSLCEPTGHLTRSPEIKFKKPISVPCKRLDTWFKDNSSSQIDFIWADVQGSQRLLIDGGREALAKTRYLYIEAHDPIAYAGEPTQAELIELLSEWFVPVAFYAKENILFRNKTEAPR